MASRIFWILLAGAALATGMVVQDGSRIFSWDDGDHHKAVRAEVNREIDREMDKSLKEKDVVTFEGNEIRVTPEQEHALTQAIARLVKAESDLAIMKVRNPSDAEVQAAKTQRDQARTEIEQLKAQIHDQQASRKDAEEARREASEIRDEIREAIRG